MVTQLSSAVRPDDIRRHNLSLVLRHVHRDGALTRAELTQRLGVSRSTVGALVGDLADLGLVEEVVPTGGDRVGRPSHLVTPLPPGHYVVAVDVEVARVTVASVGLGGAIVARETMATGRALRGRPELLVDLMAEALPRLREATTASGRMCALGVSVPGTVDLATGEIGVAPNLGWDGVPMGDMLRVLLPDDVPVMVGNDADLALLAEHQRGNARGCEDVVYLMCRIGVGAGMLAGGVPVRGRDGHAGEIGHTVLDPSGPRCDCGKHGCVETYLGEAALLELAGRALPRTDAKVAAVFAEAKAGPGSALDAVRSVAEPLGRAIANLVNTLNPERFLLGGSMAETLELARPEIEAAVGRYSFGHAWNDVELVSPAFGRDSALLGAAELAFAELLADPS